MPPSCATFAVGAAMRKYRPDVPPDEGYMWVMLNLFPGGARGLLFMASLAPIAALVIQMAVSRSREYAADATGARFAGNPNLARTITLRLRWRLPLVTVMRLARRLRRERYDLVVPADLLKDERMELLLDIIRSSKFIEQVLALGGYEVEETGNFPALP